MDDERIKHVEDLLRTYRRRLYELENQEALFGAHVSPHVRIEIQDIRDRIVRIEAEQRQYSLQQHYRHISGLRRNGRWQAVLEAMHQLDSLQPGYPDPERLREWAQRQQWLEQLYNSALIADTRGQWPAAIAALERLLRENPDNTKAKALLNEIRAKHHAAIANARRRQLYATASGFLASSIRHWRFTVPIIILLLVGFTWARNATTSTKPSVSAPPTHEQPQATAVRFTAPPTVTLTAVLQDECSLAGGKIAFQAKHNGTTEIHTINPDGTNERNVTPNAVRELVPSWSPDSAKIAIQSSRSGNLEIYVIDANGNNAQNLTNNPANDNTPAWSPNGQQIAFMSNRDGPGNIDNYNYNIYIMDADGNNVRRFTTGAGLDKSPVWSPDGRRIAFVSYRGNQFDIYIANVDGTGEVQLTNTPDRDENFPAWSPDGQRIVFSSKQGDNPAKVFQINADGSYLRQFTTDVADDDHPTWSPDGNCIAFEATLNGNSQIYIMPAVEGQIKRSISSGSTEDHNPSWSPSPRV